MSTNPNSPNIDQRLERLTERHEALAESIELLRDQVAHVSERVDKLAEVSGRHEREIERFRRAMRGALEAWLSENGE